MAVWGYVRVSTGRQAEDGESLDVQWRQLEGYAMQHGWQLDKVFREEGVSGAVPLAERPEGAAMLAAAKAGDVIVAAKLDRVFRSALDALQMVEELQRRRVSLHLLDLGGDVSGNGMSRLFLTIAAAFAEAERARIRERVTQTKRDQRQRGRYLGGKVPFGFRVGDDGELVEDAAEQAIIAHARDLRAGGATLRAVRQAVEVQHGRKLSLDALHRVLKEAI
ncbi:recombinase family protein [Siccirubricoccus sp. KC 17139]|uniref:Recombinase family protein n=1 Tax=Siccirubricoccus soli TaxID=2899147 RepID=A0ABT1D3V4_9PROT|nr:recombinase family protein [Siccirubricoccus soli]MCO6415960.1 recombinase family protein [Siccirubricoccus soli]MCP2682092.1 recombinase family protein [Siccirubricoccus soli]